MNGMSEHWPRQQDRAALVFQVEIIVSLRIRKKKKRERERGGR